MSPVRISNKVILHIFSHKCPEFRGLHKFVHSHYVSAVLEREFPAKQQPRTTYLLASDNRKWQEHIRDILGSYKQKEISSFQRGVDASTKFITDSLRCTSLASANIVQLAKIHNFVVATSMHLAYQLECIATQRHELEVERFPPQLVTSLLEYIYVMKRLKNYSIKKTALKASDSDGHRKLIRFAHSIKYQQVKKLFRFVRERLIKLITHMSIVNGAVAIHTCSKIQPTDSKVVKLFIAALNKKLDKIVFDRGFVCKCEVSKFLLPEKALCIISAMATTRVPATRDTHEVAHALMPIIASSMPEKLSTHQITQLLAVVSKYELQNGYHELLNVFYERIKNGYVDTKYIITALSSICKIPETPSHILSALYKELAEHWLSMPQSGSQQPISFRPLLKLCSIDISAWDVIFDAMMDAMDRHYSRKLHEMLDAAPPLKGTLSLMKDECKVLNSCVLFLHRISARDISPPTHRFMELLIRCTTIHIGALSQQNAELFVCAIAKLSRKKRSEEQSLYFFVAKTVSKIIFESSRSMRFESLASAIYFLGSTLGVSLEKAKSSALLVKWISSNTCYSPRALSASIFGLGCMRPIVNEMQEKSIQQLCSASLIRKFDSNDVVWLCTGLRNLGLSLVDAPEPYFGCLQRAKSLCFSMGLQELSTILIIFEHIGLHSSKLIMHTMQRLVKDHDMISVDLLLQLAETLLWSIRSDHVLYGAEYLQLQKCIREKVLMHIHSASQEICVRMLNVCSMFISFDTSLFRSLALAVKEHGPSMVQFIPSSGEERVACAELPYKVLEMSPSAVLALLPYIRHLSFLESHLVRSLIFSSLALQPAELQRLLYACIDPMCHHENPQIGALYAGLYHNVRWHIIDSVLESALNLPKGAHAMRRIHPESISGLLLSMCDSTFCDKHFLYAFLLLGKPSVFFMDVHILVVCLSCLSDMEVLQADKFRFFVRAIRHAAERKAEDFSSEYIGAFLHTLWNSGIKSSSSITTSLGVHAIQLVDANSRLH